MLNRYLVFILLLISFAGFSQENQLVPFPMDSINDYHMLNWTTEDGLPQNSVNDIVQTMDGYIWLATYGGLVRYDGINFETFSVGNTPGLKSNRIRTLLETNNGKLWIGHLKGGVTILEKGVFSTPSHLENIATEFIQDFCEDQKGNVWIATGNGLYKYGDDQLTKFDMLDGLPGNLVTRLFLHQSGAVHFISNKPGFSGIVHSKIAERTITELAKYPSTEYLNILDYNSKGELWISYQDKIVVEKDGAIYKTIDLSNQGIGIIQNFFIDPSGNIWLGSNRDLFLIPKEEVQNHQNRLVKIISPVDTPIDDHINRIIRDHEGNIWVGGHRRGLIMLKKRIITRYFPSAQNIRSICTKVVPDGDGGIWFSAQCEGLFHLKDNKLSKFNPLSRCIGELYNDPENDEIIYIGNSSELGKIVDSKYSKITDLRDYIKQQLSFLNISAIYKNKDGTLWLGTSGNGVLVFKDTLINHFTSQNALPNNLIQTIVGTSNGEIWVGTHAGIAIFSGDTVRELAVKDGLVRGEIRSIFEDTKGVIWVGSYGDGLSKIEGGQITNYSTNDGLFENIVSRITEDENGNLWMIGNLGLSMIDKKQFSDFDDGIISQLTCISFESEDGMIEGNGSGSVAKTADGRTWWPTIKGLAVVDIEQNYKDPVPPKVIIQKVRVADKEISGFLSGDVEIEKDQRDIEVTYTGLKYASPTKVNFRYKLEGYDNGWRANGHKRSITYTNLNPGEYVLRIEASNSNGVWGDESASLNVSILPKVSEMIEVKILSLILLAIIIWLLFRWRNSYLNNKRKELSLIVSMRTKELNEKNQKLEVTLADLKSTQQRLIQSEKMASLGTMVAGVSHEINNPLQFIQNGLDILKKSRNDLTAVKKNLDPSLEIIDNGIKRASEIVLSLNQFSRTNDKFDELIDLKEVLTNCLVMLRARLEPKVEILMKTPEEQLRCMGNQGKLHQAFLNLLSNAEYACDEGGMITIEAQKVRDKIMISISDTGQGIGPEIRSKIFDPFFTTKPPGQGTGLGLSITYEIIHQHNGSIEMKSKFGKGTTFTVSLPTG